MKYKAQSSLKVRIVSSTLLLVMAWIASAMYYTMGNHSIAVFFALFCLATLGACMLLWTIHSAVMRPLMALVTYTKSLHTNQQPCPAMPMPTEFAALRESLCAAVEHLAVAVATAHEKELEAERHSAQVEQALNESRKAETGVRTLLKDMETVSQKARESATRIFSAVHSLTEAMEHVDAAVLSQRARVAGTRKAMSYINTSIVEIAHNSDSAARNAEKSKNHAQSGAHGVREAVAATEQVKARIISLKKTMDILGKQAESIGKVLGVITDIADQTNLLALNAAIEAARAGDAGRGFAVVADEVRKLAEKTMTATGEVGAVVRSIQEHVRENVIAVDAAADDIVKSAHLAEESGQLMDALVHIVQQTAEEVSSIAKASERQSQNTEDISLSIAEIDNMTQDTANNIAVSNKALLDISIRVEELDSLIQAMGSGSLASVTSSEKLMVWTDDLALGINIIDEQHKMLLEIINELHAGMCAQESTVILANIIQRLKEYTVKHFRQEETYFDLYSYPETTEHKEAHTKLLQKVLAFEEGLKSGKAKVSMEIMRFLKDWLVTHITGTDKKYAPFLKKHGV